jgi:predicted nucleic acid-binding protein
VQTNQVDGGEAEAIGLVLQIRANWLLTDDAKARQFAESLGLEVHGSVGVLLWNVATGHIDDKRTAHQLLNDLAKSSLWVSERVVNAARKAIDSLFD